MGSKPKFSVDSLVADLKPVPAIKPGRMALIGMLVSTAVIGALVLIVGVKAGFLRELPQATVAASLLGWVVLSATCARLAVGSALPGMRPFSGWKYWILAAVLLIGFGSIGREWKVEESWIEFSSSGFPCAKTIFIWSVILGLGWIWQLRRLAPVRPEQTAVWASFALASLSSAGLSAHCPNGNGMHLLVWHVLLPFLVYSVLWNRLSRWILSW